MQTAVHVCTARKLAGRQRGGTQSGRTCREVGILRGLNLRGLRSILRYSESAAMRGAIQEAVHTCKVSALDVTCKHNTARVLKQSAGAGARRHTLPPACSPDSRGAPTPSARRRSATLFIGTQPPPPVPLTSPPAAAASASAASAAAAAAAAPAPPSPPATMAPAAFLPLRPWSG